MESSSPPTTADTLHSIGVYVLDLDYRYIGLSALVVVIAVLIKKGTTGTTEDYLSVGLSFLSLYTASIIGSVFLLTKPPAITKLGEGEIILVGFLSIIMLAGPGLRQILTIFTAKTSSKVIRVPINKVKEVEKLIDA